MDIAEFNLIRPVHDVEEGREVRVTASREIAGSKLSINTLPAELGSPDANPIGDYDKLGHPSVIARGYELVNRLDKDLAAANDRLGGGKLDKRATAGATQLRLDTVDWASMLGAPADWRAAFDIALLGYRSALLKALDPPYPDFDRACRLCRLTLVAALFQGESARLKGLDADAVFDLMTRRTVVLAGVTSKALAPSRKIKLIREAKVADLQVVRREWAGYIASEIANIRNVMAGEGFEQHEKTIVETETTTEKQVETRQLTETEDQSKLQSELSQEVNSQLGITINGHADASAEFKYPVVTARVSGGVDAGLSLQRSERQASKIAREAVSRALSRVDSLTRENRSRRELMRTEQGLDYSLDNKKGDNLHGVYRWVDRVDTYQRFRYPDRFLLEFEIPEPAEFYRWRTSRTQAANSAKDKPPEWDVRASLISAKNLSELARKYRASNLPPPPNDKVSVVRTISVELGKESMPADPGTADVVNAPTGSKEVEIPVPTDYAANTVRYEGEGYPVLAWWVTPKADNDTPGHLFGYHSAFATVAIGNESQVYWNGGNTNLTHGSTSSLGGVKVLEGDGITGVEYGEAMLPIGKGGGGRDPFTESVTLSPPAVNVVKLALSTSGLSLCTVTVLVECKLTDQAYHAWQLSVYDALYAAWAQWKRDYDSGLMQTLLGSAAADAGSSQRNEQVIRDELKREVISWLLDEEHFAGRPGLKARPMTLGKETDFADIEFDAARRDAPTIQFLEQAFEWTNLSYFFYPYYWAKRSDWEERAEIVANDPEFERFLRAGSARVIVPARPGFEDAVKNWLLHATPFISGQLPAPDDKLYVSLDTEIRELTSPWEGGIPGDSWQSRVSTTLLYLEKEGDLPFTNDKHQLPAPLGVPYKPKPVIEFT